MGVGRKLGLFGRGIEGRVIEVPCFARASALSFPSCTILVRYSKMVESSFFYEKLQIFIEHITRLSKY